MRKREGTAKMSVFEFEMSVLGLLPHYSLQKKILIKYSTRYNHSINVNSTWCIFKVTKKITIATVKIKDFCAL